MSLSIVTFGDTAFTLGFELAGIRESIQTDYLSQEQKMTKLFETLKRKDIGILVVDEKSLQGISASERNQLENHIQPVVLVLTEKPGDTSNLRRQVMHAIGVDVYR